MTEYKRFARKIPFYVKPHFVSQQDSCVFLITTRTEIPLLLRILNNPDYFRVIYKDGKIDTFKQIVLLSNKFRHQLDSEKWPFLIIRPYYVDIKTNLPPASDPRIIIDLVPTQSAEISIENITNRMKTFVEYKVIPDNSWIFEVTTERPFEKKRGYVAGQRRRPSSSSTSPENSSREPSPARSLSLSKTETKTSPQRTRTSPGTSPIRFDPGFIGQLVPRQKKQLIIGFTKETQPEQIAMVKLLLSHDRWASCDLPIYTHWNESRD